LPRRAREEAGHRRNAGQVALDGLQARQVRLDDLGVALEAEDQRDVDAAALGDHRLDGGNALGGGRDLHQQVGGRDELVQVASARLGASSVVGQARSHLQRDEAVGAAAGLVDGSQDGQRIADVGHDHLPIGVLHRAAVGQIEELLVVRVA
jgi:hypothetical protein